MHPKEQFLGTVLNNPRDHGFAELKFIYSAQVKTASAVRLRCEYACSRRGASHLVPPASQPADSTRATLDEYRFGFLLRGVNSIPAVRTESNSEHWREFETRVAALEAECFRRGWLRALAIAVGNCVHGQEKPGICSPCTEFPGGNPARERTSRVRPTFEAVGIDLWQTLDLLDWAHFLEGSSEKFQAGTKVSAAPDAPGPEQDFIPALALLLME